jgi:hypothetical protein
MRPQAKPLLQRDGATSKAFAEDLSRETQIEALARIDAIERCIPRSTGAASGMEETNSVEDVKDRITM